MTLRRSLTFPALAAIALLAGAPAGADAATRYAAPKSSVVTGSCDLVNACRLDEAVNRARLNDTVIILPGDYDVTYSVLATQTITVRGQSGQPRPRLIGASGLGAATISMPKGGNLSHVYAESQSASSAVSTKQATVADVIAYSGTSQAGDAKAGSGSVLRDSVFYSTAASRAALKLTDDQVTGPLKVVNVTAIATGSGSTGIENGAGGPVTIANTISRGAANDITSVSGVANAQVSFTNYRPLASSGVTTGAGNQSADPLFADAAGFNFHPVLGSPTIDNGNAATPSMGPSDPDGNERGSSPDIGAYEYVPGATPSGIATGSGTAGPTGGGATGDGTTGTATGTSGGDTGPDSSGGAAGGQDLPPEAPPALGRTVGLGPVRGSVTVQLPGASEAVSLEDGATVPVGSVVDVTRGVVELTSVRDAGGKTQNGQFWGGKFRVTQSRRDTVTELTLVNKAGRCGTRNRVTTAARRWSRLWGRDRGGRFRTRGRRGSATVRGTQWLTQDSCEGTLFRVTSGAVVVRDNAKRRNVLLKRGGKYLARAR